MNVAMAVMKARGLVSTMVYINSSQSQINFNVSIVFFVPIYTILTMSKLYLASFSLQ